MTTPPPLPAVIASLLASPTKASRRLARGLVLAYTPGDANDGRFRLTLSRVKVWPSDREKDIVKAALGQALRELKRPCKVMIVEPYLRRGVYYYHVIEWQEEATAVQEALL